MTFRPPNCCLFEELSLRFLCDPAFLRSLSSSAQCESMDNISLSPKRVPSSNPDIGDSLSPFLYSLRSSWVWPPPKSAPSPPEEMSGCVRLAIQMVPSLGTHFAKEPANPIHLSYIATWARMTTGPAVIPPWMGTPVLLVFLYV